MIKRVFKATNLSGYNDKTINAQRAMVYFSRFILIASVVGIICAVAFVFYPEAATLFLVIPASLIGVYLVCKVIVSTLELFLDDFCSDNKESWES